MTLAPTDAALRTTVYMLVQTREYCASEWPDEVHLIAEKRLLQSCRHRPPEQVRAALQALVAEGRVLRLRTVDGRVGYATPKEAARGPTMARVWGQIGKRHRLARLHKGMES